MNLNGMVHDIFVVGALVMALLTLSLYAAMRREISNPQDTDKTAEETQAQLRQSRRRILYAALTLVFFAAGTAVIYLL